MTQKIINLGTAANKGDGDVLRAAFGKVNDNFTELYAATGADVQIPNQATHGGKYLTTNGTTLSWATVATGGTTLPSQSGHEGKFLRTDSSTLSWVAITIPQDTGDLTNNEGFITEASELVNGANTVSLDSLGNLLFTNGEQIKTNFLDGGLELYHSSDNTIGIYNGYARINTFTTGGAKHTWEFDSTGTLTFPDGVSSIYTLDPATSGGINGISIAGKDRAYIGITNDDFSYGWDFRAFGLADYSTTLKPAIKFPGNGWLQEDYTDIMNQNVPLQLGSQGSITLKARLNGFSPTEHDWVFGRDGRTTFPNGAVPEHSYGAVGDKEGMVVFDSDHIYYCIDDYVTETPSVANVNARAEDLAQTVSVITIEKASNPDWTLVEVNWTITVNAVTRTVTTIGDNVDPAFIDFTLDSFIILPETSAIAFTSGVVQPDIWVRTAWTSTNW